MKVDKRIIYTNRGRSVEYVALVGPHVVSFSSNKHGDNLWLNGTLIAHDPVGGDALLASEQFEELTGMFPYQMEEDGSIMRHGAQDCSCPSNCVVRTWTDSHRMVDSEEWEHRRRLPGSMFQYPNLWGW